MRQIITYSKKDTFTAASDELSGGQQDKVSGRVTAGVLPTEVPGYLATSFVGSLHKA
jgi:hypothetical protein